MGQPNVLFIITDQHRADHLGFMGNRVVRTPNLDALAARGVVFDNAWVANPVCMPNRSTIMTGRMPSAHGVIFNDRSLDWNAGTHVRDLRRAGWRTALIGKSHLQHGMSRNAVLPADAAPAIADPHPSGWNTLEDAERYDGEAPSFPDDFYGFEHVELAIDHGGRITGHHLLWALERGGSYDDLVVPLTADAPARRRSDRWWQIYQPPYDPELHSTAFVAERTVDFIERHAGADEPWLAWASFPDPHHPMTPPGEWFDRHDPADMAVPDSLDDPLTYAPEHLRRLQAHTVEHMYAWVAPVGTRDPDLVRECVAATYGMIEYIDHGVGQILAALEATGATDDTIVVFTSDHGDMMGEHGLLLKGFMPFRGVQQVPLVIAAPGVVPGRTSSLAGSIDLAPTLLELCGASGHDGMQGVSLGPVLADPSAGVREQLVIEDDLRTATAELLRVPARTRTLVTADGQKYTRHSTGEDMAFDLVADPTEIDELGHRDPARRSALQQRMLDAMLELADDARGAPVG
ncbi:MAG: sulfatase-like hydrolase/transferase [Acidimicrobiia bacterium]|nr:sulfatase-like hydrolase/transferase [Acidimicrobiia bacterium]